MRINKRLRKAFTLVELLAVIAIIGITSTFVLINTNKKKEEYSKISNFKIKLPSKGADAYFLKTPPHWTITVAKLLAKYQDLNLTSQE